ncbi:MAG TPA: sigma-70 family RNA polymerase sigma factor [Steroidobacteraceae bacterium]|nr:sigma-70 family RNA polymerase sigma factor [Steroidobacteraceae bacterium]
MLEQFIPSPGVETNTSQMKRGADPVGSPGELPDLLLIERARGRDARAAEALMRRYNQRLFRIARSILDDPERAEQVVQATNVRAFTSLEHCEPNGKFATWLGAQAFHEAHAQRRTAATSRPRANEPAAATTERAAATSTAATAEVSSGSVALGPKDLEKAIDALPEVFRTVLVLRVVDELSGTEVATCLDLNETTVRTRLYRAQQRLHGDVVRRLRSDPAGVYELNPARQALIIERVFARLDLTAC